jgi:hypothetical protein
LDYIQNMGFDAVRMNPLAFLCKGTLLILNGGVDLDISSGSPSFGSNKCWCRVSWILAE